MTTFNFKELPELVGNISLALNGTLEESEYQSRFILDNEYGSGCIKTYTVIDGLEMMVCNITFSKGLLCLLNWNNPEYLLFHLCTQGTIQHRFEDETKFQKLEFQQNAVIKNKSGINNILNFPKDVHVRTSTIFISSGRLRLLERKQRSYLQNDLMDLFATFKAGKPNRYLGGISPHTANLVEELIHLDNRDVAGRIKTKSLIINILASQIIKHNKDMDSGSPKVSLRTIELEKIRGLAQFISDNISEPITISSLQRLSGLNPSKLQEGFNHLYEMSVNSFIQDLRLKTAMKLIETTECNISEVCYRVGLSSRSYFSKIFKDKFGVRPMDYRSSLGRNTSNQL